MSLAGHKQTLVEISKRASLVSDVFGIL